MITFHILFSDAFPLQFSLCLACCLKRIKGETKTVEGSLLTMTRWGESKSVLTPDGERDSFGMRVMGSHVQRGSALRGGGMQLTSLEEQTA